MEEGSDLITGAPGFIGSILAKKLSESSPILLSRKATMSENTSYLEYEMQDSLDSVIEPKIKINNVFHLAHDYSNKIINGKNINISGLEDIVKFCRARGAKLIYISSFMAISAKTIYGKTKLECEEIVKSYENSIIIRPSVVIDSEGGVFGTLNKLFKYSPIFPIPGTGDYPMYFVDVHNLVKFIIKCRTIDSKEIIHAYDDGPIKFTELLDINNKPTIHLPINLLKKILLLPKLLRINLKSLSIDGLDTLLTMPVIDYEHKNYTDY